MNHEKILKAMKNNKRDWGIKDLMLVAKSLGISCQHRDGSHYVFKHDKIKDNLSIPNHKDMHPAYITNFLRFTSEVIKVST